MRVLVLGASGLQGRAAVMDLLRSSDVTEVVCADLDLAGVQSLAGVADLSRAALRRLDARQSGALRDLLAEGFDVAVDLLPSSYLDAVAQAAITSRCHLVNTMYGHQMPPDTDLRAAEAGVTVMPESGLDPGIDLVLCAYGVGRLDSVDELHSCCGGIPERSVAAQNPLHYKISWSWEGVLKSYARPAVFVRDGEVIRVPADDQHDPRWVTHVDFPGVGNLEVIPNGDAVVFADLLGIGGSVRNTTRCTYRWPGHSALWHTFARLGLLSEEPVAGLPEEVTPREFMLRHFAPRLAYTEGERDLVVMRVVAGGVKAGRRIRLTFDLLDRRDLATGFLAMTRTVGFSASIVAQMVGRGEIRRRGLLTAVRDIPAERFLDQLRSRGVQFTETVDDLGAAEAV